MSFISSMTPLLQVVCMVGRAEKPLCHRFTLPQSLDTTLELWGVLDEAQKKNIRVQIKEAAERAMKAVMEEEKKMHPKERGGNKTQTDVLGRDMFGFANVLEIRVRVKNRKFLNWIPIKTLVPRFLIFSRPSSQPNILRYSMCTPTSDPTHPTPSCFGLGHAMVEVWPSPHHSPLSNFWADF